MYVIYISPYELLFVKHFLQPTLVIYSNEFVLAAPREIPIVYLYIYFFGNSQEFLRRAAKASCMSLACVVVEHGKRSLDTKCNNQMDFLVTPKCNLWENPCSEAKQESVRVLADRLQFFQ